MENSLKYKICTICNKTKNKVNFSNRKTSSDGDKTICKKCLSAHKQKSLDITKHLYPQKEIKIKDTKKDDIRKYKYTVNSIVNNMMLKYSEDEISRAKTFILHSERRLPRATEKTNNTFTFENILFVLELQSYKCAYCNTGLKLKDKNQVHIDHITPISKGGANKISNIAWSCKKCNLTKSNKLY